MPRELWNHSKKKTAKLGKTKIIIEASEKLLHILHKNLRITPKKNSWNCKWSSFSSRTQFYAKIISLWVVGHAYQFSLQCYDPLEMYIFAFDSIVKKMDAWNVTLMQISRKCRQIEHEWIETWIFDTKII